jgi:hypothetical protein
MKSLLRKGGLPVDNDLAFVTDPIPTTNLEKLQRSWTLGFWKKFSVAVVFLMAIVATSGWLYLIAMSVGTFVQWL